MAIYQSAKNILKRVKDEEVLEKIKNVDGDGSGLDADLLRGLPADFTCSKNQNGYTKLPNGLIIQWGKAQNGTGGHAEITFPISFTSWRVLAICPDDNYVGDPAFFAREVTGAEGLDRLTKAVISFADYQGTAHTRTDTFVYWIAIGY